MNEIYPFVIVIISSFVCTWKCLMLMVTKRLAVYSIDFVIMMTYPVPACNKSSMPTVLNAICAISVLVLTSSCNLSIPSSSSRL